jgi:hypothetical protein
METVRSSAFFLLFGCRENDRSARLERGPKLDGLLGQWMNWAEVLTATGFSCNKKREVAPHNIRRRRRRE